MILLKETICFFKNDGFETSMLIFGVLGPPGGHVRRLGGVSRASCVAKGARPILPSIYLSILGSFWGPFWGRFCVKMQRGKFDDSEDVSGLIFCRFLSPSDLKKYDFP